MRVCLAAACLCVCVQGRPAQDVSNLDMMDAAVLQTMLHERMFLPYTFKLKVHQDVYNDEARVKVCWVGGGRGRGRQGGWVLCCVVSKASVVLYEYSQTSQTKLGPQLS